MAGDRARGAPSGVWGLFFPKTGSFLPERISGRIYAYLSVSVSICQVFAFLSNTRVFETYFVEAWTANTVCIFKLDFPSDTIKYIQIHIVFVPCANTRRIC